MSLFKVNYSTDEEKNRKLRKIMILRHSNTYNIPLKCKKKFQIEDLYNIPQKKADYYIEKTTKVKSKHQSILSRTSTESFITRKEIFTFNPNLNRDFSIFGCPAFKKKLFKNPLLKKISRTKSDLKLKIQIDRK